MFDFVFFYNTHSSDLKLWTYLSCLIEFEILKQHRNLLGETVMWWYFGFNVFVFRSEFFFFSHQWKKQDRLAIFRLHSALNPVFGVPKTIGKSHDTTMMVSYPMPVLSSTLIFLALVRPWRNFIVPMPTFFKADRNSHVNNWIETNNIARLLNCNCLCLFNSPHCEL